MNTAGLPEPERRIVIFDGVCNLCNGFVNFIIRHDKKGLIKFTPLQSETGKRLITGSGIDAIKADSVIYLRNEKVLIQSKASLYILKDLGFPWSVFSIFLLLPNFLLDPFYNLVARTRYRVFGKRETCMMPGDDINSRFLK